MFEYKKLILIGVSGVLALTAQAQFQLPPKSPYTNSLPVVLNTSATPQVKVGGVGVLGVRLGATTETDMGWMGGFTKSMQMPSFVTDSTVGIFRHSISGTSPDWVINTSSFGLDTNAPIAVNGVWSQGAISTTEPIEAASFSFEHIKDPGSKFPQVPLCINPDGGLIVCSGIESPIITLSASPRTVEASSLASVNLKWSASNATECHAISGRGFFTDAEVSGSDDSNTIDAPKGQIEQFTIACTNDMGVAAFKSIEVSVQ